MLKILFAFMAICTMFSSGSCSSPDALKEEIMFDAYNNGYKIEITQEDASKIDELFTTALKGSYPMPALGVSLHDKTMEAVEDGIWLRFAFQEPLTVDELNFDQLLINLTKDMYGFNIIRGNDGKFDGRNFYIDLRRNLDDLYDFVVSLPVGEEKFEADFEWVSQAEPTSFENMDELKIKEVALQEESDEVEENVVTEEDEKSCEENESPCIKECEECKQDEQNCCDKECEDCEETSLEVLDNSDKDCEECAEIELENCPDCRYHLDVEEDMKDKVLAESIPSVNKDCKDKGNGVIMQSAGKKKDKDYEHMIQYSNLEKTILNTIRFQ